MKRLQLVCLFVLLNLANIHGQSVIINEVSQGADGGKEWVELLVIADSVNMKGWELGDNDDGIWHPIALFKFIDYWSNVSAGSIIVLYNGGDVDPAIIAAGGEDTDFSDGSIILPIGEATYLADMGPWGLTGGAFSNADTDDCPAIRNSADEIIHDMAITHPTATVESPGLGKVKYFTGNTTADISDDSQWLVAPSTAGTPGVTNGGDNSNWVDQSLPVEMSHWAASSMNGEVHLEWVTESESENQGFIIERTLRRAQGSNFELGNNWTEIVSFATNPDLQGQGSASSQHNYSFIDKHVIQGQIYSYRLVDVDYRGIITIHPELQILVKNDKNDLISEKIHVERIYPNPSNTEIHFNLKLEQDVEHLTVDILNINGQLVQNLACGPQNIGITEMVWQGTDSNGRSAPTGVYLLRLSGPEFSQSHRITLLK